MRIENYAIPFLVALAASAAGAAVAPNLVNYQGVLRDASDKPRNGTFDMTVRLFDAASAGNEILVDAHTGGGGTPVVVVNGLFTLQVGGGTLTDGSGAGSYLIPASVFRDYSAVWLQLEVGGEILAPRLRVLAAAFAQNTTNLGGRFSTGYLDKTSSSQLKNGALTIDTTASGGLALTASGASYGAGVFTANSSAYFAFDDRGLFSTATSYGGIFQNGVSASYAYGGAPTYGIQGFGAETSAIFEDVSGDSASLATSRYGVDATGASVGGSFANPTSGATAGDHEWGMIGHGTLAGAYFLDSDNSGYARLAYSDFGANAYGNTAGGWFQGSGVGQAYVSNGDYGLKAYGTYPSGVAGYFKANLAAGETWIGDGDTGLWATGTVTVGTGSGCGGLFQDRAGEGLQADFACNTACPNAGGFARHDPPNITSDETDLASNCETTTGVWTNRTKNFLQNDPRDPERAIVYTCLEGDEVGTYTRGSARLQAGAARVRLDPTFAHVTNPDVGLTVQVTPRGTFANLYVTSVTTDELVVAGDDPNGRGVEFDYRVNGLRIGFEDVPIVRSREGDAPLPGKDELSALYAQHPDLTASSPRARFAAMARENGLLKVANATGAAALEARLARSAGGSPAPPTLEGLVPPAAPVDAANVLVPIALDPSARAGDLVVADPGRNGRLVPANRDTLLAVVGVATESPEDATHTLLVAVGGVVQGHVDATGAPIVAGSLLVVSPVPGHAMRAGDKPRPGTIVGKALEPLTAGTGTIKVLLMFR